MAAQLADSGHSPETAELMRRLALPYIAALAMSQIQPFYIDNFFNNPSGQKLAIVGLGFSVFGYLVIRWMIKKAGTD